MLPGMSGVEHVATSWHGLVPLAGKDCVCGCAASAVAAVLMEYGYIVLCCGLQREGETEGRSAQGCCRAMALAGCRSCSQPPEQPVTALHAGAYCTCVHRLPCCLLLQQHAAQAACSVPVQQAVRTAILSAFLSMCMH